MKLGQKLMWITITLLMLTTYLAEQNNLLWIITYLGVCALVGFLAGGFDK